MSAALRLPTFDAGGDREQRALEREAAEAAGFERGFAEALAQAQAEREDEEAALAAAAGAIAETADAFSRSRDMLFDAAARFAAEIIRSALPEVAERGLAAELGVLVDAAARAAHPEIIVETSPEVADRLGERFADNTGVRITVSPALSGAVAQARWGDGGASIDMEALSQMLDRVLGDAH